MRPEARQNISLRISRKRTRHVSRFRPGLEILSSPRVDAIERLLQILQRIGHAGAQVTFAEVTEGGAGERRYSGLLEQRVGERLRLPPRLRDVGENIECAFGHAAGKSLNLIQSGDEHIAAMFEFGA